MIGSLINFTILAFAALILCSPTPKESLEIGSFVGADDSLNNSPILPALTGKYCVGKLKPEFHKDVSRNDPFNVINPNARREIVIQVYYPTKDGLHDKIPCLSNEEYMTEKEADYFANKYFAGAVDLNYLRSFKHHSKTNAKFEAYSKQKLHMFSHGLGCSRKIYQAMIEDVVSHGDIVVVVDHPYDAGIIDVDGRVIYINPGLATGPTDTRPDIAEEVGVRIEDIIFTMNQIQNKKVTFPKNSNAHELVKKCGMFGHSLGGQLSLNVILKEHKENNKRIRAGVNLDGWFWLEANATAQNPPEKSNGNTPYMTMRSDKSNLPPPFDWAGGGPMNEINTMKVQKPKKQMVVPEYPKAQHFAYTDAASWWAMTNNQTVRTALEGFIGAINGKDAHIATIKYLKWFFDNTVRGLGDPNIIYLGQTTQIPQLFLRDIS